MATVARMIMCVLILLPANPFHLCSSAKEMEWVMSWGSFSASLLPPALVPPCCVARTMFI